LGVSEFDLKTKILYDLYPNKEVYVGKYNDIDATNELLGKGLITICEKNNSYIKLTKRGNQIPKYKRTYNDYLVFERFPIYSPKVLLIIMQISAHHIGTKWVKLSKNQWFVLISTLVIGTIIAMWICVKLKIIK